MQSEQESCLSIADLYDNRVPIFSECLGQNGVVPFTIKFVSYHVHLKKLVICVCPCCEQLQLIMPHLALKPGLIRRLNLLYSQLLHEVAGPIIGRQFAESAQKTPFGLTRIGKILLKPDFQVFTLAEPNAISQYTLTTLPFLLHYFARKE